MNCNVMAYQGEISWPQPEGTETSLRRVSLSLSLSLSHKSHGASRWIYFTTFDYYKPDRFSSGALPSAVVIAISSPSHVPVVPFLAALACPSFPLPYPSSQILAKIIAI